MENIRLLPCSIGTRAMHDDLPEETDEKYYIRITASNDKLDEHHSIMDPDTTLKNFEADAKAKLGVALKDHHGSYSKSFGYGRSVDAMLTDKNELLIDFFILKDMDYNKESSFHFTSSAQLIRAIENGLVNQASVGFYGEREICNISGKPIRRYSYWDWEPESDPPEKSPYKMGKYYDVDGKQVKATYTVYDARLKEVSLVEFGSNRKTSIEKRYGATPEICEEVTGALRWLFTQKQDTPFTNELRNFMEETLMTDTEWIAQIREKLNIPDLGTTEDPETAIAALETEVTKLREADTERNKQHVISLRDALSLKDVRSTDDLDIVVEKAKTEIDGIRETVETQRDEIADLQADAEAGKAYRQARVDEAIKQGTRAYGDDFDEAYHREYYGAMPMDQLEKHIAHNKKKGDEALPAGRSTNDEHEPPPEREKMGTRQRQRRGRRR